MVTHFLKYSVSLVFLVSLRQAIKLYFVLQGAGLAKHFPETNKDTDLVYKSSMSLNCSFLKINYSNW